MSRERILLCHPAACAVDLIHCIHTGSPLCFLRACILLWMLAIPSVYAEQKQVFGEYEVHYIVLPTLTLNAEVAHRYDLPRSRDRSLVNVSVLHATRGAIAAPVSGYSTNLLGHKQTLNFSEVREGEAIYYLALLQHADEEFHRVAIDVALPDGNTAEVRFARVMYWER